MRTESDCLFFTSSGYNQKGILLYYSRCLIGLNFICKKQKWGQWRIRVSLKYFNVPWSAERQKPINLSDNIQSTVASNSVSTLFKFICFFFHLLSTLIRFIFFFFFGERFVIPIGSALKTLMLRFQLCVKVIGDILLKSEKERKWRGELEIGHTFGGGPGDEWSMACCVSWTGSR